MPNYHLIGEDMALSISIGTTWDGSLDPHPEADGGTALAMPGSPTPGSIMGTAKRVGLTTSLDKTNVKALGDLFKKNRYHSKEEELELENFVAAFGYAIPMTAVGKYIYVSYNPLSGGANGFIVLGVVTKWATDSAVASEQSLKCTIDLCPDYLATGAE
jgi:hypothetical protein